MFDNAKGNVERSIYIRLTRIEEYVSFPPYGNSANLRSHLLDPARTTTTTMALKKESNVNAAAFRIVQFRRNNSAKDTIYVRPIPACLEFGPAQRPSNTCLYLRLYSQCSAANWLDLKREHSPSGQGLS